MANRKWFSAQLLFKDGKLRESARVLLRELYLEMVGGKFGDECWVFPGGRQNREGYRYVDWNSHKDWGGNKSRMAHRLMYEIFLGEIPPGNIVLHTCDNPPCCNPNHLRVGTYADNSRDMVLKGRAISGMKKRTHCPQGHEYTVDNVYLFEGRRYCCACHKIYSRESQRRRRAGLKA